MKYNIILAISLLFSITAGAQSVEVRKISLDADNETFLPMRHKFYMKSFQNKGTQKNESAEQYIKEYFQDAARCEQKKDNYWYKQCFFCPVSEAEADVVITGTYKYKTGAKVNQKKHTESAGNPKLPYFEDMTQNSADLTILLTFKYKDGKPTVTDTIKIEKSSEKLSISELEEDVVKSVKYKIAAYHDVTDAKNQYINLPKVKIKDKALKEEFDGVKDLLKNGDYEKAGAICKIVNESLNTPESSAMIGICYEMVGNFPKAEEYYAPLNDFHIKTRMKANMKMLDFAKSIGFEPEFVDF